MGTELSTQQNDSDTPKLLETVKNILFKDVSCGYSHSAAVSVDGSLYMWGSASTGKLGLQEGDDKCYAIVPLKVGFMHPNITIRRVACGAAHTIALTTEGKVYAWGCGDGGRLGLGDHRIVGHDGVLQDGNLRTVSEPRLVSHLKNECIVDVSCGVSHSALVSAHTQNQEGYAGGNVYVAGSAHAVGKFTPEFTIVDKFKDIIIRQVSCGTSHTAAITIEGELYSWGR